MKIAVYTAVFGDKDEVKEPLNYQESVDIDYFLITDNQELASFNYKLIYKEPVFDDIAKNARFYKIKGLEIFKNYDFVIWHDANIQMVESELLNVVEFAKNKSVAFFRHSERNCTYEEGIKCIQCDKEDPYKILRQLFSYFLAGFKNERGLYETGLFVRNNALLDPHFIDFWWNQVNSKSRRDQLSLPFALQKFGITPGIIGDNVYKNRYSVYSTHKHKWYNFLSTNKPKEIRPSSKKKAIRAIRIIKKINSFWS